MRHKVRVRTVAAFLVAPISVGILAFLTLPFGTSPSEAFFGLYFAALLGYPTAIILGIPTYIIFRRRKWSSFSAFLLAAGTYSILLICAIILPLHLTRSGATLIDLVAPTPLSQMAILTTLIIISVTVFWLIDRPDRILPHPPSGEMPGR